MDDAAWWPLEFTPDTPNNYPWVDVKPLKLHVVDERVDGGVFQLYKSLHASNTYDRMCKCADLLELRCFLLHLASNPADYPWR